MKVMFVIPVKTGIQKNSLDTCIRRYDGWTFIEKPESRILEVLDPGFQRGAAISVTPRTYTIRHSCP